MNNGSKNLQSVKEAQNNAPTDFFLYTLEPCPPSQELF